jgi:hypothetical protein
MGCWCNLTRYYCLVQAADINQKATSGHLVLSCGSIELTWMAKNHFHFRKGYLDTVELLLKAGASVDAVGMYSWTPLLVKYLGSSPALCTINIER